jgi:hypothetical protein
MTGAAARAVDPEHVQRPPDSTVLYARENGEIVGRTAIIELPHVEGTWVAESKRGSSLALRLIRKLEEEVAALGRSHLFAFAFDSQPEVSEYLERVGYTRFPVTVWAKSLGLPTEKEREWILRGMRFHDELFALLPNERHEDNVQHFQDVGHCLEIALDDRDPERAMKFYAGCIAAGAPYAPISLESATPESIVIDMGEHRIAISPDGSIQLCEEAVCQ